MGTGGAGAPVIPRLYWGAAAGALGAGDDLSPLEEPDGFESEDFESEDFESEDFESEDFESEDLESDDFESDDFESLEPLEGVDSDDVPRESVR
jgi:hypothetical protein